MKKLLLSVLGIATGAGAFAQLPVGTGAQNKNVILEEYTGIHCTYCPDGHRLAEILRAANPNDVFLLNIHVGSFATPGAGEIDLRTSFGTALANASQLAGYPAGSINRRNFPGYVQSSSPASATAQSRGTWSTTAPTVMGEASYVNVACEATVDISTRLMTVDVEAYFTGSGAPSSMNLNVALTQNNIEGTQTGAAYNPSQILPNGNYNHQHALRHMLTGQWGDVITTTTSGTLVTRQYTYTLPANIAGVPLNMGDLQIVSFIAEGQQMIITGSDGPITYTGLSFANNAKLNSVMSDDVVCGSTVTPTINLSNYGSAIMTAATITYNVNGGTPQVFPWTGSLNSLQSEDVVLNPISFTDIGNNTVNVTITDVNGGVDGDPSDNNGSKANITNTTQTGTLTAWTLTVTQDRYGSEITWEVIDNATGNPISGGTGGPYSDLGASGTLPHVHNLTLSTSGCYTFNIYDSYGDGINSGYGVGGVVLTDGAAATVFTNPGTYTASDKEAFERTGATGIEDIVSGNSVSIFPNPTTTVSTISFDLTESTLVKMEVINSIGSVVFTNGTETMSAGSQKITFDGTELPNGIYFVNLTIGEKVITKKVSLIK